MEIAWTATVLLTLLLCGGYASYLTFPFVLNFMIDVINIMFKTKAVVDNRDTNIVFIVADDLGWNDISWHNPDMITPNIEKLAREGILLENYYVQPLCSPSRSAFMTGYYPFHTGLQHIVIKPDQAYGLPLNLQALPQMLKQANYDTHMVGKWHLGFCNWSYTPNYRGFDSFYGYYLGAEDYYNHTRSYNTDRAYLDFRNNKDVVRDQDGNYSVFVFAKQAIEIIKNKAKAPLFLYLPFQNVHAPLQVPKRFEDMYSKIKNKDRRVYSGMVTALDAAIGNITKALEDKGILDNTIIIVTTDNGGQPIKGGNNYPLRGAKSTLWEGGTRGISFIHGKSLAKSGFSYKGLMHATDWVPTILEIAGLKPKNKMDGMSQWEAINNNLTSPRTEFVYNIDRLDQNGAIRVGNYKLIVGKPGLENGWYPAPTVVLPLEETNVTYGKNDLSLFDLATDPNEHTNLTASLPTVVKELYQRFLEYKKTEVKPLNGLPDPKSNPKNFGGVWSPGWC